MMGDHEVGDDGSGVWFCGPECFYDHMSECPKIEACHKYFVSSDPYSLPIVMLPEGWLFAYLSAMGPNSENIDYEVSLIKPTGRFLVEGDEEVYGRGPSPRAAMLDAIEKAGK